MKKKKVIYDKNTKGSLKEERGLQLLVLFAPVVLIVSIMLYRSHRNVVLFLDCLAFVFFMIVPYFIRVHRNRDKTKQWIDSREERADREQNEFYYGSPENNVVNKNTNKKRHYLNTRYSEERVLRWKFNDARKAVAAIGFTLGFIGYAKADMRFYITGAAVLIIGLSVVNVLWFHTMYAKPYVPDDPEEYNKKSRTKKRRKSKGGTQCPLCGGQTESGECILCGYIM